MSSNLAFIKGKPLWHKFPCFTSRNNDSKGSKNSEYSIDLGFTENEYTVTDSFHFAEEVCKQDPNLYMASLDVDSLFTNILQDETIDICFDSLYKDYDNTPKISKVVFRNLHNVATKKSFFMFENKFYKQIDGGAMRSPLVPANVFMCSSEDKWLKDCPHNLKSVFCR